MDLPNVLHHLFVAAETLNATASGFTTWFQDPSVAVAVDVILRVLKLELFKEVKDYLHVWVLRLFLFRQHHDLLLGVILILLIILVLFLPVLLLIPILLVLLHQRRLGLRLLLLLRLCRLKLA